MKCRATPTTELQPCLLGAAYHGGALRHCAHRQPFSSLPPSGYLDLAPGDFDDRHGEEYLTAWEFEAKYLDPDYQPPPAVRPEQRRHSRAEDGAAGKMRGKY